MTCMQNTKRICLSFLGLAFLWNLIFLSYSFWSLGLSACSFASLPDTPLHTDFPQISINAPPCNFFFFIEKKKVGNLLKQKQCNLINLRCSIKEEGWEHTDFFSAFPLIFPLVCPSMSWSFWLEEMALGILSASSSESNKKPSSVPAQTKWWMWSRSNIWDF